MSKLNQNSKDFFNSVISQLLEAIRKISLPEYREYTLFLQKLISDAKNLTDSEIHQVITGAKSYALYEPTKKTTSHKSVLLSDEKITAIIEQLEAAPSHEEGYLILVKTRLTNDKLKQILDKLDIKYRQNSKKEMLINNLLENTVDYRTRAAAIHKA